MTDDFENMDPLAGEEDAKPNFKEIWQNNPALKIAAFAGAVVFAGLILFIFAGPKEEPKKSSVSLGTAAEVSEAPGQDVSPAYEDALRDKNQERAEQARQIGASALPTPIGDGRGRLAAPVAPTKPATDPLAEWRKAVEERRKKLSEPSGDISGIERPEVAPVVQPIQQQPAQQKKFDPAYVDLMLAQMQAILETKQPKPATGLVITAIPSEYDDVLAAKKAGDGAAGGAGGVGGGTDGTDDTAAAEEKDEVIVQAGEVLYAQLLTALNSDTPGPVLAQIVSGPLAGSRIIGSFEKTDEYLIVSFGTVIYDNENYDVEAVALNPKTTLPAVASKVDNHYFARIVLPAAAAFVEGMGKAVAQTDNTTVTVNGETVTTETSNLDTKEELAKGAEEASSKISDILDEYGDRKSDPTVTVKAGIPIGIFFVAPVTKANKKS